MHLFANNRKRGIEQAKAIGIVKASLSLEGSVVSEILASHGLLGAGKILASFLRPLEQLTKERRGCPR